MKSETETILFIGAGAAIGLYLARRFSPGATIGKIYDTYPIKDGGRVDRAWANQKISGKKYLGEHRPDLINYIEADRVVKRFRLHSIEFGNWMNQEDRLNYLVATGASLTDMAKVLGVSEKHIGFDEDLSISLGARGHGGRAAGFFVPSYMVINLTKPHGYQEVLGHEYGHAVDYILGKGKGYASGGKSTRKTIDHKALEQHTSTIAYNMEMVFKTLYYDDRGNNTAFHDSLLDLSDYYQSRVEVWARTFETFLGMGLELIGRKNKFLASTGSSPGKPPRALVQKAMPYIHKLNKIALLPGIF